MTGIGLLVTVTSFEPVAIAFPLWVAILSLLLLRARSGPAVGPSS